MLKELHLQNTHLLHLTPILDATNLEVLDISFNSDIYDIGEFKDLSTLRQITFDKDIKIPDWLKNGNWEYKIELRNYYYEVYIFIRRER